MAPPLSLILLPAAVHIKRPPKVAICHSVRDRPSEGVFPAHFANFAPQGRRMPACPLPHLSTLKFGECEFVSCRGRPHHYLAGPARILHAWKGQSCRVGERAEKEGEEHRYSITICGNAVKNNSPMLQTIKYTYFLCSSQFLDFT